MRTSITSDLQCRAEAAARRFETARKPIVFEFAGVPKAGKTSTLGALQIFFKRCGFRVEVVVERASICPVRDKKHFNFNVWTACTTLAQLLEKTQNPPRADDPHILILDRGIFDALCWLSFMEKLERIRPLERETIEKFMLMSDWRKRISAVFVMTVSPEVALDRETGMLPVQNASASIMNRDVLKQMLGTTKETSERLRDQFRIINIDSSKFKSRTIAQKVARAAIDIIEEHLDEEILCIRKDLVLKDFSGITYFSELEARRIAGKFLTDGEYEPRAKVEANKSLLQALPIVIIRNRNGDVLRLKRREADHDNPLHEKTVIWAGGHARKEDKANGDTLVQCALREVQEELRLNLDADELRLCGAIYAAYNARSAKHVAIVFEWRAATDDVAIVLSSAEFIERRGTSVSGTFVSVRELAQDVEAGRMTEEWSVAIVRDHLAKDSFTFSKPLL